MAKSAHVDRSLRPQILMQTTSEQSKSGVHAFLTQFDAFCANSAGLKPSECKQKHTKIALPPDRTLTPEVLYDFYIYVNRTHHAPTFFTGNPTRTSRGVHILIFSDFDRAEKILSNLQKSSNFVIFDHFSTLSNNLHSLKRSKSFRVVCI